MSVSRQIIRHGTAIAAIAIGGGALAACGGGTAATPSAAPPASSTMTTMPMTTAAAAVDAKPGFGGAVDLRVALNRLLGEHMLIAADATQVALGGGPEFKAVAGALGQNTDDLSAAIGSLYGPAARSTFASQWAAHNGEFVAYTVAVSKHDDAAKKAALVGLAAYQKDFGAFLAGATGLPASAVSGALGMHIEHTAAIVDDFAKGDYTGSYTSATAGYTHIGTVGDVLAGAIATQKGLGMTDGDAASLRVELDNLLAEHASLAIVAMERGFRGSPDFKAAAAALDDNTVALADLIGSAFGPQARDTFLAQWRAHIGFFVNYTIALAKSDTTGEDAATKGLDGYVAEHGAFLAGATGLPVAAVTGALRMHVDKLLATIKAYAAGDYATAASDARLAYAHMYDTGDALASGIIATKKLG